MATSLPPLAAIERLSPFVIRILGGNPSKFTLQGTNTYLIGRGPSRLLLDTGEGIPAWKSHLSSILKSENTTVSQALITHWHEDHVGGITDLLALCPDAKVYKNSPALETVQIAIEDGMAWEVPGMKSVEEGGKGLKLKAMHTPGHTVDHMVFILESLLEGNGDGEEVAMFTGDNVLGHGTAVFEDLGIYMSSLSRMKGELERLGSQKGRHAITAYPGHGASILDGKARVEEYIAHRRQREEQVLAVLAAEDRHSRGAKTAKEIVKVVYKDVPESLHDAAERGVVHILRKLTGEGKVAEVRGEGRWIVQGKAAL